MALRLYVFCRSERPLPLSEIAEFIQDGVYFDDPTFEISEAEELSATSGTLFMTYEDGKAPVEISIHPAPTAEFGGTVSETIDAVEAGPTSPERNGLIARLKASQQVVAFALKP